MTKEKRPSDASPGVGAADIICDDPALRDPDKPTPDLIECSPFIPGDATPIDTTKPSPAGDNGEAKQTKGKTSNADLLASLALQHVELFHSDNGDDAEAFASFDAGGARQTWPIDSRSFRRYVSWLAYVQYGKAPKRDTVGEVCDVLAGKAIHDSPARPTGTRIAEHNGVLYVDLCDEQWRVVAVDAGGWAVIDSSSCPVRFIRRRGMQALPVPVGGGHIEELRPYMNAQDDDDWGLLVGYIIACFHPAGPYPVLILNGEKGSAKSTTCRVVRSLVDPNRAALRRPPRNDEDLILAASNAHVVAFDNLSGVSPYLSDGICCIATGSGFGARQLYTDGDERLFAACKPVLLNGIDEVATRADLLDRAIRLTLPRIDETDRRDEKALWRRLSEDQPRIFGALLDAVSSAMADVDSVQLASTPRMADACRWITAAEDGLPWPAGRFVEAYRANHHDADIAAIESSIVGTPVVALVGACNGQWQGTAGELLTAIEAHTDEQTRRRKSWPGSPTAMGNGVRRIASSLRANGINVNFDRDSSGRRLLTLSRRSMKTSVGSVEVSDNPTDGPENGDSSDTFRHLGNEQVSDKNPDHDTKNPDADTPDTYDTCEGVSTHPLPAIPNDGIPI